MAGQVTRLAVAVAVAAASQGPEAQARAVQAARPPQGQERGDLRALALADQQRLSFPSDPLPLRGQVSP